MASTHVACALVLLVVVNLACYGRCQESTSPPAAEAPDTVSASPEAPKAEETQADPATSPADVATPSRATSAGEPSTPPPLVHHQDAAAAAAASAGVTAPSTMPEAEKTHKGGNSTASTLWPSVSIALSCVFVVNSLH